MDRDTVAEATPDVPLIPAAAVGWLLFPAAARLILEHPPANDAGRAQ